MAEGRVTTLYESPDNGFGQIIVYQDTLYPDSVIIVKTDGKGREATDTLISKEAILSVAKRLEARKLWTRAEGEGRQYVKHYIQESKSSRSLY